MSHLRSILLLLTLCPTTIWAQSFNISVFDESQGIYERFIYTVEQTPQGYIHAGSAKGVYILDGVSISLADTSDGLASNFVNASVRCGDSIFYGHFDGALSLHYNDRFTAIRPGQGEGQMVIDMVCSEAGDIWALSQNGEITVISDKGELRTIQLELDDSVPAKLGVAGADKGLLATDLGAGWIDMTTGSITWIDELFGYNISAIIRREDLSGWILAVEDEGLMLMSAIDDVVSLNTINFEGDPSQWRVKDLVWNDNELWIATNNDGLIKLSDPFGTRFQNITEFSGQNAEGLSSVSSIFFDRESNLWLGTLGESLMMLKNRAFVKNDPLGNASQVSALLREGDRLWIAGEGALMQTDGEARDTLAFYRFEHEEMTGISLCRDADGRLWLGTHEHGLWYLDDDGQLQDLRLSNDQLNLKVNDLHSSGGLLYVATDYGIYQLKDKEVLAHLSMLSGLPHNVVNDLYEDEDGRLWIGADGLGLAYIEDGVLVNLSLPFSKLVDATALASDDSGRIWVGSNGAGILAISETDTLLIDRRDGLFSDYCYSMLCDDNGYLWVGHRGGLSRIGVEDGKVQIYDANDLGELAFQQGAIEIGRYGRMYFGTNEGLLSYDQYQDISSSAIPVINMSYVNISDSLYSLDRPIELPYGAYRIDFGFVGVSFADQDEVRYRYLLEGHDLDWSELVNDTQVRYSRLNPGEYTFRVKAYNREGMTSDAESVVLLSIAYPFWQRWWFAALITAFIFVVARIIIRRREYVMRQNQERLQKELDIRTREVVEQKEKLEVTNKDLTDSIRYAKNIQKAMLPEPDALTNLFNDAFVFYKPRNIVSGDFYWVEKFGSKVILACADCTGHGVPGGFMSMIGSVLLKDVSQKSSIQSPAEVLHDLDKELTSLLYKEESAFAVQDGMDVSIVEFDVETRILRFSGARRPLVAYVNGERVELKGDRHSVGGADTGEAKSFEVHELKLDREDIFYLFSDGISDQFGGERGKKLKKSGLLNIFDRIQDHPMEQQRKILHQSYFEWKGFHDQVDDIIVLGVRV